MLRCADNSLYCGITVDVDRRIKEHNTSPKGAKYTRNKRPVHLVYTKSVDGGQSGALKAEIAFKKLTRK